MKKPYLALQTDILLLSAQDVITTSDGDGTTVFGLGDSGDNGLHVFNNTGTNSLYRS